MINNIGGGPLLKTYDNMLHNMLLPSTYNGNITVVGITSVKLTSIVHTLGWTLFLVHFGFMYAEIIHDSVCFGLCLRSVQVACHDH